MSVAILTARKSVAYPAPPTRDELLNARWHFQGLPWSGAGGKDWFEPAIGWIAKEQRASVYALKDAATFVDVPLVGDQIYGISLSGAYREDDGLNAYAQYAGYDFSKDLSGLNALIDEIITGAKPGARRYVRLFCAGDGQGAGPGYNSDVGLTYGADWLMNFTPTLLQSLGDRYRFVQFFNGYDDTWYGWDPSQLVQWPQIARAIRPDIMMGFEHSAGIGPFPFNETTDWMPGGALDGWDICASEYNPQPGGAGPCLIHDDALWQISGRLDRPFNRPSDMPSGDDPNPPMCFGASSRGARVHEHMEWSLYYGVRGQALPAGVNLDRQYIHAMAPTGLLA